MINFDIQVGLKKKPYLGQSFFQECLAYSPLDDTVKHCK